MGKMFIRFKAINFINIGGIEISELKKEIYYLKNKLNEPLVEPSNKINDASPCYVSFGLSHNQEDIAVTIQHGLDDKNIANIMNIEKSIVLFFDKELS